MKKKIKVTINYKILLRNVILVIALIIGISLAGTYAFGDKKIETRTYTVEPNNTIWNIAKKICSENNSLNVQNVIYDIEEINNISDSSIYVGQELQIPLYN